VGSGGTISGANTTAGKSTDRTTTPTSAPSPTTLVMTTQTLVIQAYGRKRLTSAWRKQSGSGPYGSGATFTSIIVVVLRRPVNVHVLLKPYYILLHHVAPEDVTKGVTLHRQIQTRNSSSSFPTTTATGSDILAAHELVLYAYPL